MTRSKQTVMACKRMISELPPDLQESCNEVAEQIRRVVTQAGNPIGMMALALVLLEVELEESK